MPVNVYKLPTALLQDALNAYSRSSLEIEDMLCVCKRHLESIGALDTAYVQGLYSRYNVALTAHTKRI